MSTCSVYTPLSQPSWRIEKKYTPRTLIGNWFEERRKYQPNKFDHGSTYGKDFKNFSQQRPDVVIRRKGQARMATSSSSKLLEHHDKAYHNNMITWYDEYYNKTRPSWNKLPDLRDWNLHHVAWLPERSDQPRKGPPTNWGLYDAKQRKWDNVVKEKGINDWQTNYMCSYNRLGLVSAQPCFGEPKRHRNVTIENSPLMHPYNNRYTDNHYRNVHEDLKYPETLKHVSQRPRTVQLTHYLGPAVCSLDR